MEPDSREPRSVMKVTAVFQENVGGGYSAAVPALPGCFSEGQTLEEARADISEAAEGWLEVVADDLQNVAFLETPELIAAYLAEDAEYVVGEPVIEAIEL
jgi:predicted RNase H-like HicB family nuclease